MPRLDHFHAPLSQSRHREALQARWAAAIADALNDELLPERYFVEAHVHIGGRIEVEVATFEERNDRITSRSMRSPIVLCAGPTARRSRFGRKSWRSDANFPGCRRW